MVFDFQKKTGHFWPKKTLFHDLKFTKRVFEKKKCQKRLYKSICRGSKSSKSRPFWSKSELIVFWHFWKPILYKSMCRELIFWKKKVPKTSFLHDPFQKTPFSKRYPILLFKKIKKCQNQPENHQIFVKIDIFPNFRFGRFSSNFTPFFAANYFIKNDVFNIKISVWTT